MKMWIRRIWKGMNKILHAAPVFWAMAVILGVSAVMTDKFEINAVQSVGENEIGVYYTWLQKPEINQTENKDNEALLAFLDPENSGGVPLICAVQPDMFPQEGIIEDKKNQPGHLYHTPLWPYLWNQIEDANDQLRDELLGQFRNNLRVESEATIRTIAQKHILKYLLKLNPVKSTRYIQYSDISKVQGWLDFSKISGEKPAGIPDFAVYKLKETIHTYDLVICGDAVFVRYPNVYPTTPAQQTEYLLVHLLNTMYRDVKGKEPETLNHEGHEGVFSSMQTALKSSLADETGKQQRRAILASFNFAKETEGHEQNKDADDPSNASEEETNIKLSGEGLNPNNNQIPTAAINTPNNITTPTPTSMPPATSTPMPPATSTPMPPATSTPMPPATSTPMPPATSTPMPPATSTPMPPATSTPTPTLTPPPASTPIDIYYTWLHPVEKVRNSNKSSIAVFAFRDPDNRNDGPMVAVGCPDKNFAEPISLVPKDSYKFKELVNSIFYTQASKKQDWLDLLRQKFRDKYSKDVLPAEFTVKYPVRLHYVETPAIDMLQTTDKITVSNIRDILNTFYASPVAGAEKPLTVFKVSNYTNNDGTGQPLTCTMVRAGDVLFVDVNQSIADWDPSQAASRKVERAFVRVLSQMAQDESRVFEMSDQTFRPCFGSLLHGLDQAIANPLFPLNNNEPRRLLRDGLDPSKLQEVKSMPSPTPKNVATPLKELTLEIKDGQDPQTQEAILTNPNDQQVEVSVVVHTTEKDRKFCKIKDRLIKINVAAGKIYKVIVPKSSAPPLNATARIDYNDDQRKLDVEFVFSEEPSKSKKLIREIYVKSNDDESMVLDIKNWKPFWSRLEMRISAIFAGILLISTSLFFVFKKILHRKRGKVEKLSRESSRTNLSNRSIESDTSTIVTRGRYPYREDNEPLRHKVRSLEQELDYYKKIAADELALASSNYPELIDQLHWQRKKHLDNLIWSFRALCKKYPKLLIDSADYLKYRNAFSQIFLDRSVYVAPLTESSPEKMIQQLKNLMHEDRSEISALTETNKTQKDENDQLSSELGAKSEECRRLKQVLADERRSKQGFFSGFRRIVGFRRHDEPDSDRDDIDGEAKMILDEARQLRESAWAALHDLSTTVLGTDGVEAVPADLGNANAWLDQNRKRLTAIRDLAGQIRSAPMIRNMVFAIETLHFVAAQLRLIPREAYRPLLDDTYMETGQLAEDLTLSADKAMDKLNTAVLAEAQAAADGPDEIPDIKIICGQIRNQVMEWLLGRLSITHMLRLEQVSKSFCKLASDEMARQLFHELRRFRIACRETVHAFERIGVVFEEISYLEKAMDPSVAERFNPTYFQNSRFEAIAREVAADPRYKGKPLIADIAQWGIKCNFNPDLSRITKGWICQGWD